MKVVKITDEEFGELKPIARLENRQTIVRRVMTDHLDQLPNETPSEWQKRRARIQADGALEVLQIFGFDIDDVHEMQKDILYLRRLRQTHESIGSKAIVSIVGLFFAGVGALVVHIWSRLTNV